MTDKRFTETLSTGIVTDHITGKEYKCEMRIDDKLLELLNELHEEKEYWKQQAEKRFEKNKNCYNCKNCEGYSEGEGYGYVFLCEKDCMNTDGYFDYEYHRFKKPCICPFWELEE